MLKDHYRVKDMGLVVTEIERILVISQKALQMAETAQFERKQEVVSEILGALENLMMLNRKKIEEDVMTQAMEYVRNYYHG